MMLPKPHEGRWRIKSHSHAQAARGDLQATTNSYRRLLVADIGNKWTAMVEPRFGLALARLLEQGWRPAGRPEQYTRFLELWKDADAGFTGSDRSAPCAVR